MILSRASLAVVLLLASEALATGLKSYKDWNKSPEYTCLATEAEQKAWKKITSDEEAALFIQLFWAKRDPDLKTPANEFKVVFDRLVKEADQLFAMPRLRGALTERGKLYILLGPPKTLSRQTGTRMRPLSVQLGQAPPVNEPGTSVGESIVTFLYEAEQLPEWAPMKSFTAQFVVEESRDFVAFKNGGAVNSLEIKARAAALRHPDSRRAPPRWTSPSRRTIPFPSRTRRNRREFSRSTWPRCSSTAIYAST